MDTRRSAYSSTVEELSQRDQRKVVVEDLQRASGSRRSSVLTAAVFAGTLTVGLSLLTTSGAHTALPTALFGIFFFIRLGMAGYFRPRMVPDVAAQAIGLARTAAGVVPVLYVVHLALDLLNGAGLVPSPGSMIVLAIVCWLIALSSSWFAGRMVRRLWSAGRWRSRALLIGSGELARQLSIELRLRRDYGVDVVCESQLDERDDPGDALIDCLVGTGSDRVIILPPDNHAIPTDRLAEASRTAISLHVPTFVVPGVYETSLGLDSMRPDRIRGVPMAQIQRSAHPQISLTVKRLIDIAVASLALLATAPVLGAAALAVKLTSPGPILFRQPRVGRNGKVFDILKLRSMTESDNEHSERTSGHRITPIGRFIRATFIDELPQLFNILAGDMTLVGPRPERVAFVDEGLRLYDGYALRHRMPMGLTGLAQVAGLRGEDTSVQERTRYDNLYIDHWSLGLDLQIVLRTFAAVFMQSRSIQQQLDLTEAIAEDTTLAPYQVTLELHPHRLFEDEPSPT